MEVRSKQRAKIAAVTEEYAYILNGLDHQTLKHAADILKNR
jgi:hypothetical protein